MDDGISWPIDIYFSRSTGSHAGQLRPRVHAALWDPFAELLFAAGGMRELDSFFNEIREIRWPGDSA